MNILQSLANGGIPLTWDDLRFVSDKEVEALDAYVTAFAQNAEIDSFIVFGCEYDQLAGTLTAGFIYLNGELRFVDAAIGLTSPTALEAWFWIESDVFPSAGLVTLEDGFTTTQLYKSRQAGLQLTDIATPPANSHRYNAYEGHLRGVWVDTTPSDIYFVNVSKNTALGSPTAFGFQVRFNAITREFSIRGYQERTAATAATRETVYGSIDYLGLADFAATVVQGIAPQTTIFSAAGDMAGFVSSAIADNSGTYVADLEHCIITVAVNGASGQTLQVTIRKFDGARLPTGAVVMLNHTFKL